MHAKFYSPNTFAIGSAKLGQNSYSVSLSLYFIYFVKHHADHQIGVAVIDRFSYHTLEFLDKIGMDSSKTIYDLVQILFLQAFNQPVHLLFPCKA